MSKFVWTEETKTKVIKMLDDYFEEYDRLYGQKYYY